MPWSLMLITGLAFGLGAVLLVQLGNPGNYGFCAACQLRDIAGALGIHSTATLQYARPEVLGWVLGACAFSKYSGEFRVRGGSSPLLRFILGALMMLGALVFLGCPLRSILRLAAGDLNGLTALAGFAAGIAAGIVLLKRGFSLSRATALSSGYSMVGILPAAIALALAIAVMTTSPMLNFSAKGPGSMHAPVLVSLTAGLITGALASRTRMCLSGGFRDFMLVGDTYLLRIYGIMFAAALFGNLYFGTFKLGFTNQPLAHTMHLWNFLGLFLVGVAATLAGSAAGVSLNGQIAVVSGITIAIGIGLLKKETIVARFNS